MSMPAHYGPLSYDVWVRLGKLNRVEISQDVSLKLQTVSFGQILSNVYGRLNISVVVFV